MSHTIDIEVKQKKPNKTFMMIMNLKKAFGLHGLYLRISGLYGLIWHSAVLETCLFNALTWPYIDL